MAPMRSTFSNRLQICAGLLFLSTAIEFSSAYEPFLVAHDTCVAEYAAPQLRYPPPILRTAPDGRSDGSSAADWDEPTAQQLFGTHFLTYSTRQSYLSLTNMRAEHYPIYPQTPDTPAGSEVDIVSWSTLADPNDTTITTDPDAIMTVFGYLKPPTPPNPLDPIYSATWNFSSTGILASTTNMFSILAIGVDTQGVGYRIDYETGYWAPGTDPRNGDPCLNIASRSETGPSTDTLRQITYGLMELGLRFNDRSFADLVKRLKPLRHDGRRTMEGPVACDQSCVMNAGLKPI